MTTTMDAALLRELFLQRLPPNVRMVLTPSAAVLSLEQLAQLADPIVEASPTPATISAVNTHSELTTQVMELSKRLDQQTNQMSGAINNITKRHGRSPSASRRRRRRSFISRDEDSTHPLCWYHRKFGDNVKMCQPPCQKSGNDWASRFQRQALLAAYLVAYSFLPTETPDAVSSLILELKSALFPHPTPIGETSMIAWPFAQSMAPPSLHMVPVYSP